MWVWKWSEIMDWLVPYTMKEPWLQNMLCNDLCPRFWTDGLYMKAQRLVQDGATFYSARVFLNFFRQTVPVRIMNAHIITSVKIARILSTLQPGFFCYGGSWRTKYSQIRHLTFLLQLRGTKSWNFATPLIRLLSRMFSNLAQLIVQRLEQPDGGHGGQVFLDNIF